MHWRLTILLPVHLGQRIWLIRFEKSAMPIVTENDNQIAHICE